MPTRHAALLPDAAREPFLFVSDPGWLSALRASTDAAPTLPRMPLGRRHSTTLIGSIEPAWADRLIAAGAPLRPTGHGWAVDVERGAALDSALAAIAALLRRLGPEAAGRGEHVTVNDSAGKPVARIERAATRALGIATQAVHLVGATAKGSVWVQQRALANATDPGQWDTMIGGLTRAGEGVRDTLRRAASEDAGLRLGELGKLSPMGHVDVRRPVPDGYMIERIEMFEALLPDALRPLNQTGEVAAFECLAPPAVWQRLRDGRFTREASLVLLHWLQRHRLVR